MLNLRVYDTAGNPHYIDQYASEPIKLNLSIEDITNAEAKSTFSRTFRVPSNAHNNQFFENAFLIEGIDFDVTIKVPADIEVNGAIFRQGHIRLQKIYTNEDLDRIDYELLFLGETRDFASVLGETGLCELDGSSLIHDPNYVNIVASWQAYPQGPGLTSGLLNGDIIYPLIDYGNTYDNAGFVIESEIRTGAGAQSKPFDNITYPVLPNRFKPMIRAKKLLDLIFAQTQYTYSSVFLNSNKFQKIYVSAWGNESTILNGLDQTEHLFAATQSFQQALVTGSIIVKCNTITYDAGNNFNPTAVAPAYAYVVPITGTYTFSADSQVSITANPGTGAAYAFPEILVNGARVALGGGSTGGNINVSYTGYLTAGDYVQFAVDFALNSAYGGIALGNFACTSAPGDIEPSFLLDCDYKQIDYFKDILTMFRLVMAPDRNDPQNFTIEPWVDYIASGELYDWTAKVDRTKDFQIEPLFFTQSDRIEFKFAEDKDVLNNFTQDSYKQVYGQLNFDSDNELLKDTRQISVNIAPTPLQQIEGEPLTSAWIIPQIHTHGGDGSSTQHLPIKPVTRILFYNGLAPTPVDWYMSDGATTFTHTSYPFVSYQEGTPVTQPQPNPLSLNLNWQRWFSYYGSTVPGWDEYAGISLWERYWSDYIQSLYNPFARRLSCNVILNSVDLQNFTFDDVVFIDGVYYRPEKIIDAPIGQKESVAVKLIKLLDYRPPPTPPINPVFYYYEIKRDIGCITLSSTIWILQSSVILTVGDYVGVSGDANCYIVVGLASTDIWDYALDATFLDCETCAGEVVDDYIYYVAQHDPLCNTLGNPWISVSSVGPLALGSTHTLTTRAGCWELVGLSVIPPVDTIASTYVDCEACSLTQTEWDGEIHNCLDLQTIFYVTLPYPMLPGTVFTFAEEPGCWVVDGPSPAPIDYVATGITEFANCETCNSGDPVSYIYEVTSCDGLTVIFVQSAFPLAIGTVVELDSYSGCWEITGDYEVAFPVSTITVTYPDCLTCNGIIVSNYVIQNCANPEDIRTLNSLGQTLTIGQAIGIQALPGICFDVIGLTSSPHNATLNHVGSEYYIWTDCEACANSTSFGLNWLVRSCVDPGAYKYIAYVGTYVLGNVVKEGGTGECWELVGRTLLGPNLIPAVVYSDCITCGL